jgi:hypothetical protein
MTSTLWFAFYPWLLAPLAALGAGGITWALVRGTRPAPGELWRHFLVAFGLCLLLTIALVSIPLLQRGLYWVYQLLR